ncbi:MAG TPA: SUMF1/EgtB/PvdO family nonheme iron enzyme [Anaerolineales bacterium]|nr:SUMF1/EgtB/PvdO family nonheme iron enzyme [Anaerolineales bacterium]
MARIEKTVFIGYRRKDISWALAVYQYLTAHKYDVFFDYNSLSVGDFEAVIVSNIKARAHFILILTPTALDRCNEPGDWLRREVETAIDEKRNIIPVFFEGFSFGAPSVAEKLTGKLETLNRYNGLDVPSGYFPEAMERLNKRYLGIHLDAVLHPVPKEVRRKVKEEQAAANEALKLQKNNIRKLLNLHGEEKSKAGLFKHGVIGRRVFTLITGIFLFVTVGLFGYRNLSSNLEAGVPAVVVETELKSTDTPQLLTATIKSQPVTATVSPVPTSEYTIGSSRISPRDGMTLLYIPGGTFTMGADADDALTKCEKIWNTCERDWFLSVEPPHQVSVNSFWIDKTEVTTSMYQACVEAGSCKEPRNKSSNAYDGYYGDPKFEDYPMIQVDWNMANAYCEWTGRRLPTEAEWERAAKGDNTWIFPWGDNFDGTLLNYCDSNCPFDWADSTTNDGYPDVAPVGSFPSDQSIYGAQDMSGNVLEWVADWYDAYPGNTSNNKNYGTIFRVNRGGSWANNQLNAQLIFRGYYAVSRPAPNLGFRCAMDAE